MRHNLGITFCLALTVSAQEDEISIGNTFGLGARAMGMGGAFLGVADDFSALYWNPAGLAQIRKFELYGGLSHLQGDMETQFTGERPTEADESKTRPNSIGLVYPLYATKGGVALGLGYNRLQNFDTGIAISGIDPSRGTLFSGLDVDELNVTSGGIGLWSFGVGVFISENILLGGSFDFWHGTSLNELDVTATDVNRIDPEVASFSFHDVIDREYTGVSGRLGLLARAGEYVTIGLVAQLPIDLEVDEAWLQETEVSFDDGETEVDAESGSILFDIERPFEFGGGVAVTLLEKQLTLAGDFQFTDWTQTEYSRPPTEDISPSNFDRFYDSTLQIRLGAEYRFREIDTTVRVGYFRDPIPFQGKEIENDRDFLTVGAGKVFDDVLKLDVAYMRGSWERMNAGLTEKQTENRVLVSAAYRY